MEGEHNNEDSNLANNGVNANLEPLTKITNKKANSPSRENVKLLAEIDILPFVGKAEPPEHHKTGSLSREVLVENFVPEVGNEIIVKTENEYLVPTEEGKRPSVSSAVVEPGDNFKDDNLLADEVTVEKNPFQLTSSAVPSSDSNYSSEATANIQSRNKHTRKISPANSTISNPVRIKCHSLSVSELRRRLSVCPVCQFQYTSYKLATVCLTKHGKRQCWLCLDVLSTRKDDYYRHCIDYHSISRTGDNVGCPFCPKFFDFRQGLNQHIVKIHFAENISDLYAVASLSPKTLVDIFTGQPREISPISSKATPSPSRESSCGCELDTIHEDLPLTVKSIFDNAFKNLDTSSSIEISSAVIPPPATPLNDGVVCNRQAFPNLTKASSSSSSSPGSSSVIRLLPSRSCAQKMAVPPEQTMKSLAEQIAIGESGSLLSSTSIPFPNNPQQLLPAQNRYSGENPEEHEIEVLANAGLKFHHSESESSSYNYDFGRNQPPLTPSVNPPTLQMSTVTSDPEKYEMSFYPDFPLKGRFQEGAPSVIAASFGGDDELRSSYEKDIIRMDTSGNSARINSYEAPGTNIIATVMSSASRPNEGGENRFACLTEAEKNYLDSITKLLESSEMEFNGGIVEAKSNGDGTQPVSNRPMEVTSSITDCPSPKEGNILDLEIKRAHPNPCDPQKQPPLNCGVKRRILMKAMWDEQNHHQVKKPAVPETHALVHALHAATSFLTQPVTSGPKSTSPAQFILTSAVDSISSANVPITSRVNRSYNEVCFGVKAETGQEQQKLQPPQSVYVSQGQVIKHAGPFFEQYVRQEGKKLENPYKLLNIAGSSRAPEMVNLGIRKNSPCVDGRSWGHTSGGGCINPGSNMHYRNDSHSPNQRQSLAISSPTYTRPQFPTPYQFPIRKGSNPTFWDNLRARLMTQSGHKLAGSSTFSRSNDQTRGAFSCGIPKLESVIVKNPFEEEVNFQRKSRRISSIPSLLELKLGNEMNQLHHGGILSMSRGLQPPPLLPSHSWREPARQLQQFHHPFSGINIPAPGMIRRSGLASLGQREFPSSSPFQPPLAPPTPAPRYQLHQQHQQMMDQCRRISHGSVRECSPQSYNSRFIFLFILLTGGGVLNPFFGTGLNRVREYVRT